MHCTLPIHAALHFSLYCVKGFRDNSRQHPGTKTQACSPQRPEAGETSLLDRLRVQSFHGCSALLGY